MNNKDIVSSVLKHIENPLYYRLVCKMWNKCIVYDERWVRKINKIKKTVGSYINGDYIIKEWETYSPFHAYVRYSLKNIIHTDNTLMKTLTNNNALFNTMCSVNKRKRKCTYWIDSDCIYKRNKHMCINFTPNVFIKNYIKIIK